MMGVMRPGRTLAVAILAVLFALAALAFGCERRAERRSGPERRIEVGGVTRTYRVHAPPRGAAGLPVVLAFHGGFGTGAGMGSLTHLNATADRNGFVVVYPDGLRRSWNDGRSNTPAEHRHVDDVAFVSQLIDRLVRDDHVDARRVYATGISNGGMFTERLGCDLAGRLAGIAPVAGPLPSDLSCHPARPLPVLVIHGTADPLVPYDGGHVRGRGGGGSVLSVSATADVWLRRDACTGSTTVTLPDRSDDGTRVRLREGTGCTPHTGVAVYTIVGGGHTWPGGLQYLPERLVGRTSRDLDAGQVMWDFFDGQS